MNERLHKSFINYGTLCILVQNRALKAFPDLRRHDIILLQQLALLNYPVQHRVLKEHLDGNYTVSSTATFQESINNLLLLGAITRKNISTYTMYSISARGRELLIRYNNVLDQLLRDIIFQHGNGL